MKRVTVDDEMRRQLMNCTTPLELCDEHGTLLARLVPSTPWTDPQDWIALGSDPTDEEIQRMIDCKEEAYSTQELIDQIKQIKARRAHRCSNSAGESQSAETSLTNARKVIRRG